VRLPYQKGGWQRTVNTDNAYLEAVRAYADGVRVLFAPSGEPTGERGGRGPVSYSDLAEQAEHLLPSSEQVIETAAAQLAAAAPEERAETETALLAKALTDLEVSEYLLQAARDAEAEREWLRPQAAERGVAPARSAEPYLQLMLGAPPERHVAERAPRVLKDLGTARVELMQESTGTLVLITSEATDAAKEALGGLLGMGLGQIAKAASVVGMDIAQALGQAEKVSKLYDLFRGFLLGAYDTFVALLGPELAKVVREEVQKWLKEIEVEDRIGGWLAELYGTEEAKHALKPLIADSQVELAQFVAAIEQVDRLKEGFRRQADLVSTILPKLKWLGVIPAATVPQGQLLLAAAYIVLGGYVILLGADYVDAQRVQWLDRVPGVRRVVKVNLKPPQGG
jgi:hypothetical protein